jgi:tRNA (guanine-N7-)-methyltransferase
MNSNSRPIRSYVLRQGRISEAQRRASEQLFPKYGIAYRPGLIDLDEAFGRSAPRILEIGSGMGETTAQIAQAHPDCDYLAVEVHAPGVGSLLRRIEALDLQNVRIIRHDAVEVVRDMIGESTLARVHLFFPDPWPKKRHHKRRLLQPEFVHALARRLAPGACLHVATDWQDYAARSLEILRAEPLLENTVPGFAPRPAYRPLTKFESRGVKLGHGVWDLVFRRRAQP